MQLKRLIAISVIISSLGLVAADAQSLRSSEGPANFPPSSFTGKQFVDNRGCAFVRAGIDGRVTWVPRVSRSRKLLCGLKPTFSGSDAQVAQAAPAKRPVQITNNEAPAPAAKPQAKPRVATAAPKPQPQPKPKPKPQRVAQAQPKPKVDATPTTRPSNRVQRQVQQQTAQRAKRVQNAPQITLNTAPAPRVQKQPQVQRVKPAPQPVKRAQAKPQVKQPVRKQAATNQVTRRATTSCGNFKGISAQYAGSGAGVRCGPQNQAPTGQVVQRRQAQVQAAPAPAPRVKQVQRRVVQAPAPAPRVTRVKPAPQPQQRVATAQRQPRIIKRDPQTGNIPAAGNTRVVPRHVYENNQASKVPNKVPKGFRKAWDDDRLNTKRAHMTVNGIRQSDLVWTRTVPRKLYIKNTGRVVNHLFPKLRYPYTSMAQQNKAMGLTTSSRSAAHAPKKVQRQQAAAPQKAAAKGRYVQVGMFANPANAKRAAQKIANAGLPARMGTLKKGGKTYRLVMAGPFAQNQLGAALSKARRAGFSDAYVR